LKRLKVGIQITKKPLIKLVALPLSGTEYFWRKPGYAIITEGVHELSVRCMNTSFSLVNTEDTNAITKKETI
jgi:hypothetical protein